MALLQQVQQDYDELSILLIQMQSHANYAAVNNLGQGQLTWRNTKFQKRWDKIDPHVETAIYNGIPLLSGDGAGGAYPLTFHVGGFRSPWQLIDMELEPQDTETLFSGVSLNLLTQPDAQIASDAMKVTIAQFEVHQAKLTAVLSGMTNVVTSKDMFPPEVLPLQSICMVTESECSGCQTQTCELLSAAHTGNLKMSLSIDTLIALADTVASSGSAFTADEIALLIREFGRIWQPAWTTASSTTTSMT